MTRPQKVIVFGLLCGLAAVVLVRLAVVLLVGGFKVLALVGVAGFIWLALRNSGPRTPD